MPDRTAPGQDNQNKVLVFRREPSVGSNKCIRSDAEDVEVGPSRELLKRPAIGVVIEPAGTLFRDEEFVGVSDDGGIGNIGRVQVC